MKEPLVSIIIPSYNYAHLIEETLFSVVRQRYQNWECIIIDDGSTDQTVSVVNNFISQYPTHSFTFKVVENGGTSATKNQGIQLAQGKYVQFLDADDLLSEEKLAHQVALAERENTGLVFSGSKFFAGQFAQPEIIQKYPEGFLATKTLEKKNLFEHLVRNNILTINSALVSKELVVKAGMFDADLKNNEDWLFWFKVAQLHPKFIFDDNPKSIAWIRVHGNSAMTNHAKMFNGEVVVRQYMDEVFSNAGNSEDQKHLKKLNLDLLALHQIRSLSIAAGMKYIFSSFIRNPVQGFALLWQGAFKLSVRFIKT